MSGLSYINSRAYHCILFSDKVAFRVKALVIDRLG